MGMAVTLRETGRVLECVARLLGRSTCLRSGPWGLALCGGPLGSRQTFPFGRQLPCKRLGRVEVTDYFNISGVRISSHGMSCR